MKNLMAVLALALAAAAFMRCRTMQATTPALKQAMETASSGDASRALKEVHVLKQDVRKMVQMIANVMPAARANRTVQPSTTAPPIVKQRVEAKEQQVTLRPYSGSPGAPPKRSNNAGESAINFDDAFKSKGKSDGTGPKPDTDRNSLVQSAEELTKWFNP